MHIVMTKFFTHKNKGLISVVIAGVIVSLVVVALPQKAQAAISLRGATSANNGGGATTLVLNTPSGVVSGDTLLISADAQWQANISMYSPPGWNTFGAVSDSANYWHQTFYLQLSGAPAATYSVTLNTYSCGTGPCVVNPTVIKASGGMVAYSGVNSTPIESESYVNNASSTTWSSPNVSTTNNNDMVLAFFGSGTGTTVTCSSCGATLEYQNASTGGGAASRSTSAGTDVLKASKGAIGVISVTAAAAAPNVGEIVILKPLAPDAPTLNTPASNAGDVNLSPVFTLRTTDALSNPMQYAIILYQSDCSTVVANIGQTLSQTGWSGQDANAGTAYVGNSTITSSTLATYTYAGALSPATTYCWKAAAIEPTGSNNFGPYSSTQSFTTSAVPAIPTLSAPAASASGVLVIPVFTLRTTDVDNDYLKYKILLYQSDCTTLITTIDQTTSQAGWYGQDANGGTAYVGNSTLASSTLATYTYTSALSGSTQYCWKAAAIDPAGTNTFGAFSAAQTFTTGVAVSNPVKINGGTTFGGGTHFGN